MIFELTAEEFYVHKFPKYRGNCYWWYHVDDFKNVGEIYEIAYPNVERFLETPKLILPHYLINSDYFIYNFEILDFEYDRNTTNRGYLIAIVLYKFSTLKEAIRFENLKLL